MPDPGHGTTDATDDATTDATTDAQDETSTPPRVLVAHPRTLAALGTPPDAADPPPTPPYAATPDDLGAPSHLGDLYLRSLMRTQLRLGLSVVGALVVLLGGIPLACAVAPALRDAHIGGVPVPWLLVAVAPHPVFIVLGTLHLRHADANERGFAALLDSPATAPAADDERNVRA